MSLQKGTRQPGSRRVLTSSTTPTTTTATSTGRVPPNTAEVREAFRLACVEAELRRVGDTVGAGILRWLRGVA